MSEYQVVDGVVYDDVLLVEHATGDDAVLMRQGSHYDYQRQVWVEGQDHAHMPTELAGMPLAPLMFCGTNRASCGVCVDEGLAGESRHVR